MLVTNDAQLWEKALLLGHFERVLDLPTPNRRFAATGMGLKLRMSPLNAAVARVQLKHLQQRNRKRTQNIVYLSQRLEALGFETFLSPANVQRVYFEFLVRYNAQRTKLPIGDLVSALKAEGVRVENPRYPLLHQQPLFTEGHWAKIARLSPTRERPLPQYDPQSLPQTESNNGKMLKLPSFPSASTELLDQYAAAFEKVLAHVDQIPRGRS